MTIPAAATTGIQRIEQAFARRHAQGQIALMPYMTMGFPEKDATADVIEAYVAGGADLIEMGVPFSDPLADGVTIQRSSQRAIQNGVTLRFCIEETARLRERGIQIPLMHMSYYNPILHYGIEQYCADAAAAGVDGLLVPDLTPEEADALVEATGKHGLALIPFVAPTSTDARIEQVARIAQGFIYCVSLTGVTGARKELATYLTEYLGRVRKYTDKNLAVGFGISRPEHVATISRVADGAIIGAALVNILEQLPREERYAAVTQFLRTIRPVEG